VAVKARKRLNLSGLSKRYNEVVVYCCIAERPLRPWGKDICKLKTIMNRCIMALHSKILVIAIVLYMYSYALFTDNGRASVNLHLFNLEKMNACRQDN